MKKIILALGLLIATTATTFSQVYRYKAYAFNYKSITEYGWTDWDGWKSVNIPVVVDATGQRIVILSETEQNYAIMKYEGEYMDENRNTISSFYCVDSRGIACRIRLVRRLEGGAEIYIGYKDMMWAYGLTGY